MAKDSAFFAATDCGCPIDAGNSLARHTCGAHFRQTHLQGGNRQRRASLQI